MKWVRTQRFSPGESAICQECGAAHYRFISYCHACNAPKIKGAPEIEPGGTPGEKLPGAVRIAHLTDLHIGRDPGPQTALECFRRWLRDLAEAAVDVVVVSGDLVDRPEDRAGLQKAHRLLSDCGMAWCVVPGNHDVARLDGTGAFYDIFGTYPRVETLAGVEFALFDSMSGLLASERAFLETTLRPLIGCFTEGRIGPAQLAEISQQLQSRPEVQRVGVLHHHVAYQAPEAVNAQLPWLKESVIGSMKALFDAHPFLDLARAKNITTVLHGHHHRFQKPGTHRGNILVMNGGSSTLNPRINTVRIIDLVGQSRLVHLVTLAS